MASTVVHAERQHAVATAFCIATDATGICVQPTTNDRTRQPSKKGHFLVQIADREIVQRWILARIRNELFHSLGELHARIRELFVDLNGRVMRRYAKSRRELFEHVERDKLRPLPSTRFEYSD